jgi:FHS family L-fucose permease-like MFS transporter
VVYKIRVAHDNTRLIVANRPQTAPSTDGRTMSTEKKRLFVTDDGKNLMFTFILVSSLFLLWGLGNGMIDVMDKHFQNELHLTKSQSAWVQFAHYLGYFLMAMPAGWLASRMGYKVGIIAGLLMVAVGGFWFLPATHINALAQAGHLSANTAFVGFLAGVCTIAAGFTFLETVANPYTTVLGPQRYSAARINLAQSCNGIGWLFGPIIGAQYFYSTDAAGQSTGSETLYIPYVVIGLVVLALSVVFFFARVPDIKAEDDYHLGDEGAAAGNGASADRQLNRVLIYVLLLLNSAVLLCACGMILWLILKGCHVGEHCIGLATWIAHPSSGQLSADTSLLIVLAAAGCVLLAAVALGHLVTAWRISHRSIWSHPHFSAATMAQFFYVAAQAGIFSFLINYMTSEVPPLPAAWQSSIIRTKGFIEISTTFARDDIKDLPALADKLTRKADAVSSFLSAQLTEDTAGALNDYHESAATARALQSGLIQDLNTIVKQDPKKAKAGQLLYDPQRFQGISLGEKTRHLLAQKDRNAEDSARLNRMLLQDAFPGVLAYHDGTLSISDKLGSNLVSFGFLCFFIGRYTGASLMKRFSAHKVLGLYGALNIAACLLVFLKLGWLSVACVFLSYFFMSVMFPTIFALGIFGLGARAKKASSFIVMAIMGGAILPKLMGYVADQYDMSRGFIVPMACFVVVALYGFFWPKFSGAESLHAVRTRAGD